MTTQTYNPERTGMLTPYRVLDLTDEKGLLCGKILGDLGADVIKIEPPGGDAARQLGPFYHDEIHPEKSLFWFSMNTSKRGITLNLETADGREIFKRLVKTADFVVESFPPGYLDSLGLGYSALEQINPGVIMISISPFGQTGPYRHYKTSDIVAWAVGGDMTFYGDLDREPLRISHHSQCYMHAGADGAMGAVVALYHRRLTGEGQQIDVSIQDSATHCSLHNNPFWPVSGQDRSAPKRGGGDMPGAVHQMTRLWPCKDGWVSTSHGGNSRLAPSLPLVKWMESEGMADEFLLNFNWDIPNFNNVSKEDVAHIEEATAKFFMTHTKAELLEGAVNHRVMLYPVSTTEDIMENPQLAARGFWVELEHPELNTTLTYPGAFAYTTQAPMKITRRAPLIGEHNEEIYCQELGLSKEHLILLKQIGAI